MHRVGLGDNLYPSEFTIYFGAFIFKIKPPNHPFIPHVRIISNIRPLIYFPIQMNGVVNEVMQ